jgi:hypothetical protein
MSLSQSAAISDDFMESGLPIKVDVLGWAEQQTEKCFDGLLKKTRSSFSSE